jgi:ribokinase
VIGSLDADLATYTSRMPDGRETLHANSFKVGSGGKGATKPVHAQTYPGRPST